MNFFFQAWKQGSLFLFLLILIGGLMGDMTADAAEQMIVMGTATYRERIMLPPNAVFEAVIVDASRADIKSMQIGKTQLTKLTGPPIHFSIPVDAKKIDKNRVYVVRAKIVVDSKLMFTSERAYPVFTRGAESFVDISLVRTGQKQAGKKSNAPLVNTYWKIITMHGEKVTATGGKREPHLILKTTAEKPKFAATVGCNLLMGGFTAGADSLTFNAPVSTRMACPPPLDKMEKQLNTILLETRQWRTKGDTLELLDENGSRLAFFEAVYF